MHIGYSLALFYILTAVILIFVILNEIMMSLPHNLVLDSQPGFGLAQSEFLHLYNFLIN